MDEPATLWVDVIFGCLCVNAVPASSQEQLPRVPPSPHCSSVSVVAVLETLISAFIADRLTKTLFDQRREVLGIGITNFVTGILGGIPATAALARTSLNIRSGATSRASGIVNGFALIILSVVLFDLFKYLPLPGACPPPAPTRPLPPPPCTAILPAPCSCGDDPGERGGPHGRVARGERGCRGRGAARG